MADSEAHGGPAAPPCPSCEQLRKTNTTMRDNLVKVHSKIMQSNKVVALARKLQVEVKEERARREAAEQRAAALDTQLQYQLATLHPLRDRLAKQDSTHAERVEALEGELEVARVVNGQLQARVEAHSAIDQREYDQKVRDVERLLRDNTKLESDVETVKMQLAGMRSSRDQFKARAASLEVENRRLKKTCDGLTVNVGVLQGRVAKQQTQAAGLKAQLAEARKRPAAAGGATAARKRSRTEATALGGDTNLGPARLGDLRLGANGACRLRDILLQAAAETGTPAHASLQPSVVETAAATTQTEQAGPRRRRSAAELAAPTPRCLRDLVLSGTSGRSIADLVPPAAEPPAPAGASPTTPEESPAPSPGRQSPRRARQGQLADEELPGSLQDVAVGATTLRTLLIGSDDDSPAPVRRSRVPCRSSRRSVELPAVGSEAEQSGGSDGGGSGLDEELPAMDEEPDGMATEYLPVPITQPLPPSTAPIMQPLLTLAAPITQALPVLAAHTTQLLPSAPVPGPARRDARTVCSLEETVELDEERPVAPPRRLSDLFVSGTTLAELGVEPHGRKRLHEKHSGVEASDGAAAERSQTAAVQADAATAPGGQVAMTLPRFGAEFAARLVGKKAPEPQALVPDWLRRAGSDVAQWHACLVVACAGLGRLQLKSQGKRKKPLYSTAEKLLADVVLQGLSRLPDEGASLQRLVSLAKQQVLGGSRPGLGIHSEAAVLCRVLVGLGRSRDSMASMRVFFCDLLTEAVRVSPVLLQSVAVVWHDVVPALDLVRSGIWVESATGAPEALNVQATTVLPVAIQLAVRHHFEGKAKRYKQLSQTCRLTPLPTSIGEAGPALLEACVALLATPRPDHHGPQDCQEAHTARCQASCAIRVLCTCQGFAWAYKEVFVAKLWPLIRAWGQQRAAAATAAQGCSCPAGCALELAGYIGWLGVCIQQACPDAAAAADSAQGIEYIRSKLVGICRALASSDSDAVAIAVLGAVLRLAAGGGGGDFQCVLDYFGGDERRAMHTLPGPLQLQLRTLLAAARPAEGAGGGPSGSGWEG